MRVKHPQTVLKAWLAVAVTSAIATSAPELWTLDIAKVMQGEWWRLASGHLVHLSWHHFLYDMAALGLSLCLCGRTGAGFRVIAFTALLSVCVVSATLQIVHPVDIYGGISGITAGLLSFAALRLIARDAWGIGTALLAVMLFKIGLEWQGMSASNIAPVWQAHCAGAVAGLIVFILRQTAITVVEQRAGEGHEINSRY